MFHYIIYLILLDGLNAGLGSGFFGSISSILEQFFPSHLNSLIHYIIYATFHKINQLNKQVQIRTNFTSFQKLSHFL